jgi:hypothetical protein
MVIGTTLIVLAIIVLASVYNDHVAGRRRRSRRALARWRAHLGGHDRSVARRLLNVVEEMAIAAGVAMPRGFICSSRRAASTLSRRAQRVTLRSA